MEIERGMEVDRHRRAAGDRRYGTAHEDVPLRWHHRDVDPGQVAELPRPRPGTHHGSFAAELAVRGDHALDPASPHQKRRNWSVLVNGDAEPAGSIGISEG